MINCSDTSVEDLDKVFPKPPFSLCFCPLRQGSEKIGSEIHTGTTSQGVWCVIMVSCYLSCHSIRYAQ